MDGPAADPAVKDALNALDWDWGEAYEIEVTAGEWRARRRDGVGGWMTAANAEDLRAQIVNDYTRKPVSRPAAESLRAMHADPLVNLAHSLAVEFPEFMFSTQRTRGGRSLVAEPQPGSRTPLYVVITSDPAEMRATLTTHQQARTR